MLIELTEYSFRRRRGSVGIKKMEFPHPLKQPDQRGRSGLAGAVASAIV